MLVICQPGVLVATVQLSKTQREHLAARIRRLGEERGLTSDRAIADRAFLAPKALLAIANGQKGPTLSTLLALCRALRVYSIDQLLGFSATVYFTDLDEIEGALGGMTPVLHRQLGEPNIR